MSRSITSAVGRFVVVMVLGIPAAGQPAKAEELRVPFRPADVDVRPGADGTAVLSASAVQWLSLAGEPNIPWQVVNVLLPPDASLETVSVRLKGARYESLDGAWTLAPAAPAATSREGRQVVVWPRGKRIVNGCDADVYGQDALWPDVDARLVGTGRLRKWRMAQVAVPLFKYNPAKNGLKRLVAAELIVDFKRGTSNGNGPRASAELSDVIGEATVRRIAVNFDEQHPNYEHAASTARASLPAAAQAALSATGNPGYVIITTAAIQAASTQLAGFVAHKESKGFDVQVVTEADFGGGVGDAAAENIRTWLQGRYISDNIEYVLLVGNPHPASGDVPMKMLYPRNNEGDEYKESPSDYYYADLTGNWDLDGDGYYGEWGHDFGAGGVDRNWEVLVGRIPVYDDATTNGVPLYDSGPPRRGLYNGSSGFVGFTSGNLQPGLEQRWSAQPFQVPGGSWHISRIDVDYFIPDGRDFDILKYIVWRRTGQDRPQPGDELIQGAIPAPAHRTDSRIGTSNNYLHQIPVDFQLDGGDYYLTIYAARSNEQQGGGASWLGNTEFGIPLLNPVNNPNPGVNAFFWRSAKYPSPGFVEYNLPTSSWAPKPGQDPNQLYTAAFTVYGVPAQQSKTTDREATRAAGTPNVADLDHILAKIMAYENAAQSASAWRRNVLLPMKSSDDYQLVYFLGEEIKDTTIVPKSGWSYHRVYDQQYSLTPPPETTPCSVDSVTAAWTAAPYGCVIWHTHGWETGAVGVMDSFRAATLDDAHPAFTFQSSCLTAHPETADNLAYSLLKNGAASTVAATRVSWGGVEQTQAAGTPSIQGMAVEYAQRLIGDESVAGMALHDLKQALVPTDGMWWMNYTDFCLYGCPAVGLYSFQPDGMTVSPGPGLSSEGDAGGPFVPQTATYTVRNESAQPIDCRVAKAGSWVSLNGGDGPVTETLAPGQAVDVVVGINEQAERMPASRYADTVSFANLTTGAGDTTRSVSLESKFLFDWAAVQTAGDHVATDAAGNILVAGSAWNNFYMTKLAEDASVIWTRSVAGEAAYVRQLAVTVSGDLLILGSAGGTSPIDFDPTDGEDWHSPGTFVTRLHSDGSYGWTNVVSGILGRDIACDAMGNIYVTGSFGTGVDFDPSAAEDWRWSVSSSDDIFVTKYAPDGSYAWTYTIGAASNESGLGIAVDFAADIVVAGYFGGVVDFDPGAGTDTRSSAGGPDAFVTKLHPDGSYAWTRTIGGYAWEYARDVAVDRAGNILIAGTFDPGCTSFPCEYITGYFVDFDPTDGTDLQVCHGGEDTFVTKLHSDGSYAWTGTIGNVNNVQSERPAAITVDAAGSPVVVGTFGCCVEVDFDPTPRADWRTSLGARDIFVTRLTADGGYAWTGLIGGAGDDGDEEAHVAVDRNGNVALAGNFIGSADLDPTEGEHWYSSAGGNNFITRIVRAAAPTIAGDFDDDGDVDLDDFLHLADCLAGPGVLPSPAPPSTWQQCLIAFDVEGDVDVDVSDFGAFQEAFGT